MTKKERYRAFIRYFSQHMPTATTELQYTNSFQLLVAVILSAQCTDKRINQVTPPLFRHFPTPQSMAAATPDHLFPYIRSVSYPRNKARYLVHMSRMLVKEFNGIPPSDINQLQRMSGVGRKTANVIASVIYDIPAMPVDTHVIRVSKRLGLVTPQATTPLAIEKQLVKAIQKRYINRAHHWLIFHGRRVCLARKPQCPTCPLQHFCLFYAQKQKKTTI